MNQYTITLYKGSIKRTLQMGCNCPKSLYNTFSKQYDRVIVKPVMNGDVLWKL